MTTRELAAATGATERQIVYWGHLGILRHAGGGGTNRRGGFRPPFAFPASEAALARVLLRLPRFLRARRRIVEAIRRRLAAERQWHLQMSEANRAHREGPFYVLADRLGKRVRFADSKAEVVALATAARYGVLLVEVGLPTTRAFRDVGSQQEVKP